MIKKRIMPTPAEVGAARDLITRAQRPRALPIYSAEEWNALVLVAANFSLRQGVKAKKGTALRCAVSNYRREHVNLLLRYVLPKRYRQRPNSLATRMRIVAHLDKCGITASETQVRRDINKSLKRGPLQNWSKLPPA